MVDLHTHSVYSDGSLTPSELVALAERTGLSAVALCDHNTLAGIPEFLEAAKGSTVEAIPGIEFSTEYRRGTPERMTELHLLGLFIPMTCYGEITREMEEQAERKEECNRRLAEALCRAGYAISYDEIRRRAIHPNRAHFAAALVEAGYAESSKDAFARFLSPNRGFYHPPARPDVFETIEKVRRMGGVPILAHPLVTLSPADLIEFLPDGVRAGLVGMETEYSDYSDETTALAKSLAETFSLAESGGSDFHGDAKPDIRMGVGRGNLAVCDEKLEILKGYRSAPDPAPKGENPERREPTR
ncbi:MAG: PHP domain-containing protein [Eubacteriales bacterium]